MKNQGRKSITLSLQVSVIGNIPSGNFKLGSPKEVFLIKNITDEGAGGSSVSATLTLNQTAGDPTLEVSPTSIDVPQDGSEVQVQVTTNTTFTVS